ELERLQRLTQVVARRREEAALALVGAIRQLARSFGGIACLDELRFDALAIRYVANHRSDERALLVLDRAQADLDSELRAVLASPEEFLARSDRSSPHAVPVAPAIVGMMRSNALPHEEIDGLAHDLIVSISEQPCDLDTGIPDRPRRIDDQHRVRGRIQRVASELGRGEQHGSIECPGFCVKISRYANRGQG